MSNENWNIENCWKILFGDGKRPIDIVIRENVEKIESLRNFLSITRTVQFVDIDDLMIFFSKRLMENESQRFFGCKMKWNKNQFYVPELQISYQTFLYRT